MAKSPEHECEVVINMSRWIIPNNWISVFFHFLENDFFGCHTNRKRAFVQITECSHEQSFQMSEFPGATMAIFEPFLRY